jgi:glutathione synthase/RimK-type ligase-like ATP-grasp enzyme
MTPPRKWVLAFSFLQTALTAAGLSARPAQRAAAGHAPPTALIVNGAALAPALAAAGGVDVVFRSIDELSVSIENSTVTIAETVSGRDLRDFGLVHMASYPRPTAALISAIVAYLEHHRVPAVNMAGIGVPTKLVQYVRFGLAGLPVPPTVYLARDALMESFPALAQRLDLPFVLKALSASGGRYNYLVGDERQFVGCLRDHERPELNFLAQRFVPNDTTYRLLVLGGMVGAVIRRTWARGTHLTNTAQGGYGALVDPEQVEPSAVRLGLHAASLMGSEVAGVNLMQDWTTGEWYVLGTDTNPALTTGVFVAEKLTAYSSYLRRRLGNASGDGDRSHRYPRGLARRARRPTGRHG